MLLQLLLREIALKIQRGRLQSVQTSSFICAEIVYDIYCMSAGKNEVKTTCAQLLSGGIRDIVDNPENCPIFNYLL